jgi:hypothetical protein
MGAPPRHWVGIWKSAGVGTVIPRPRPPQRLTHGRLGSRCKQWSTASSCSTRPLQGTRCASSSFPRCSRRASPGLTLTLTLTLTLIGWARVLGMKDKMGGLMSAVGGMMGAGGDPELCAPLLPRGPPGLTRPLPVRGRYGGRSLRQTRGHQSHHRYSPELLLPLTLPLILTLIGGHQSHHRYSPEAVPGSGHHDLCLRVHPRVPLRLRGPP